MFLLSLSSDVCVFLTCAHSRHSGGRDALSLLDVIEVAVTILQVVDVYLSMAACLLVREVLHQSRVDLGDWDWIRSLERP